SGYTFLFRQLAWAVTGITAMFVAMKVDYRRYKHPAVVFSVLGVTTLMLISVFFLDRTHHTHRWIHWGSFSFQPSEIAKPALILFLAFFLECRTRSIDDWRDTLLPAIIPTAVFLGLIIFQPDLGTAIACAAITGCVLFVAVLRLRYLGYVLLAPLARLYFVAGDAHLPAHARYVRTASGGRHYQHGGSASVHQCERGVGPDANQRDSTAICFLRRLILVHDSRVRWRAAEY